MSEVHEKSQNKGWGMQSQSDNQKRSTITNDVSQYLSKIQISVHTNSNT